MTATGKPTLAAVALHAPTADELVRFRDAERRTARVLEAVAAELFPGITERTAARVLEERLIAAGAGDWILRPRVLFGARATLPRPGRREDPRPGWSTLDLGEGYLLEAVPLLGGIPGPGALAGGLRGRPPGLGAGLALLERLRAELPRWIRAGASAREVARAVAAEGARAGWRDATAPRPGWALARRIERLPRALAAPAAPFGAAGLERALLGAFRLRRRVQGGPGRLAVWSDDPGAASPIPAGLWLVAPRFARASLGIALRAFLWIDGDGPRWLADGPLPRV